MERITHELIQKSPEWLLYRATHDNASDAAAMLNCSPHKTRTQLMHERYLGLQPEFSDYVQTVVLDPGNEFESLARPLAEEIIGESLFPATMSFGQLSASLDGLTFMGGKTWEHKRLSRELEAIMVAEFTPMALLPKYHRIQVEQQFMVTDASEGLFSATKWNAEGELVDARHAWTAPDFDLREEIAAGWIQFHKDLAVYVPARAEKPKPVGKTMASLPALFVMVEGKVTESNLEPWKAGALAAIRSVSLDMVTDEDFASAENNIRWCERGEEACDTAEAYTLSQTSSIADALKAIADVREQFRKLRLVLKPAIMSRKTARKEEIIGDAVAAFHKHTADLSADLAPYRLPAIPADFAAQTVRKSSFKSMQDAVDAELARAKIAANGTALRLRVNITRIAEAKDVAFLFNDAADLIAKDTDAVEAIVSNRIRAHQDAEEKRAAALREKIAAEEKAKAEAAAHAQAAEILRKEREAQAARDREAKVEADRLAKIEADAQAARDHEAAEERRRQDAAALAERQQAEEDLKKLGDHVGSQETMTNRQTSYQKSSAYRHAFPALSEAIVSSSLEAFENASYTVVDESPPVVDITIQANTEHAWINITKMNDAFGFTVTADFIVNTLGFQWTRTEKATKFWTPTQFEAIKRQLAAQVLDASPIPF